MQWWLHLYTLLPFSYRKIDSESENAAKVQRLLNIASEVCGAHHASTPSPPPSQEQATSGYLHHLSPQIQSHKEEMRMENEEEQNGVEDDEAFWSQAAEVLEDWEEDEGKGADRDSAFIDELLSSGLIRTPKVYVEGLQSTPDNNQSLSPPPHSTHVIHSPSSSGTHLLHRSHFISS